MAQKIDELMPKIFHSGKPTTNFRLFLLGDKKILRIFNGKTTIITFSDELGLAENLRCDRGNILDLFSKLEFMVNEIIRLKLLGPISENNFMLDAILENVDFFSRIKLLFDWNIIDKETEEYLMKTKQVRNGLAHKWSESEVNYNGKPIKLTLLQAGRPYDGGSFNEFKNDMKIILASLWRAYKTEQKNLDLPKLLEPLFDKETLSKMFEELT